MHCTIKKKERQCNGRRRSETTSTPGRRDVGAGFFFMSCCLLSIFSYHYIETLRLATTLLSNPPKWRSAIVWSLNIFFRTLSNHFIIISRYVVLKKPRM